VTLETAVALALAGVLGASCGSAVTPEGRVHALVTRPPKDTVRFDAPARVGSCRGKTGVLLSGSTGGNGVVVWLRSPDSLTSGSWTLLQRGDTVSPRGATVGARFMVGDVAHGVTLDSGAVQVTRTAGTLGVEASGTGLESVGGRVALQATFDGVRVGSDTAACDPRP
jgi:hypothetical protein